MASGLGIDIGSRWIKVVQVRTTRTLVTVTGALKIPRPGPSENGAQLVPPALGRELAQAKLRRSGTVGVSGREVMLKYLATPPMPPERLKMLIDMQIGNRMLPGTKKEEGPAVTYDYRLLNVPTGLKGDLVIMAALAKNAYLFGVFAALKEAGLRVNRTTPSAFGLVQTYLRTQKVPPGETVVLVDVGHELLELAILNEENLYFARSSPGGGKKFSDALNQLLKLGAERIEDYKVNRARIYPEGEKLPSKQELQFQAALKRGADGIAGAVRSAVMFCRTQAKLPKLDYQRVFLSGGGARLQGLREYLEKKIKRPVQVLDLYTGLDLRKLDAESARCFEGEIPDMAVALGLAIVDADPKVFHFGLVPEAITRKRTFWHKTVFGAAAGVLLLASLAWPYRNAQASLEKASGQKERFEGEVAQAKKKKRTFEKRRAANVALRHKVDYYARQTRLGRVYLDVFAQMRAWLPRGMKPVALGPPGGDGPRGSGGAPLGPEVFDAPLRKIQVRGYYDTGTIHDFEAETASFFDRLKEVAGVESATRNPFFNDKDMNLAEGLKGFEFTIGLADPGRPIVAPKAGPEKAPPEPKSAPGKKPKTAQRRPAKKEAR